MFQGLLLETFVSVTVAKVHGTLLTLDNLDFHSFSTAVVVLQFLSNHMNWTCIFPSFIHLLLTCVFTGAAGEGFAQVWRTGR